MGALICGAAERNPACDLSSLQHVGFGAEMIVPDIVLKVATLFRARGATKLKQSFGFGMTETGLVCRTPELTLEEMKAHLGRSDATPILGHCIPDFSVRIVGDDDVPLPSGAAGNIQVRSETALFSGYLGEPELTAQSFTPDGWFRTGDRGTFENDELRIVGRQKSTIIVNGRNVSLEQIEAPLRLMEGISQALVVAAAVRQLDSTTDALALFFVPQDAEAASLDALCRAMRRETAQNTGIQRRAFRSADGSRPSANADGQGPACEAGRPFRRGPVEAVPPRTRRKHGTY